MDEKIPASPALTPEEWARDTNAHLVRMRPDGSYARETGEPDPLYFPTRHGIAAMNLYGQYFGFTHADVGALREVAEEVSCNRLVRKPDARLLSLADRIQALLPPRNP